MLSGKGFQIGLFHSRGLQVDGVLYTLVFGDQNKVFLGMLLWMLLGMLVFAFVTVLMPLLLLKVLHQHRRQRSLDLKDIAIPSAGTKSGGAIDLPLGPA